MKRLAEAFKGRTAAYDEALTAGDDMKLASAVSRNVLGIEAESEELTRYIVAADARTQTMTLSPFQQGAVPFPDPALFVTRPL
jgi:cytochrome b pre-mRNA-processing protein 3